MDFDCEMLFTYSKYNFSAFGEPPKSSFSMPWEEPHPSSQGNLSSSNGVLASSGGVPIMEDEFDLLSTRYKTSATTTSYAASGTGQSDAMNFDLLGGWLIGFNNMY